MSEANAKAVLDAILKQVDDDGGCFLYDNQLPIVAQKLSDLYTIRVQTHTLQRPEDLEKLIFPESNLKFTKNYRKYAISTLLSSGPSWDEKHQALVEAFDWAEVGRLSGISWSYEAGHLGAKQSMSTEALHYLHAMARHYQIPFGIMGSVGPSGPPGPTSPTKVWDEAELKAVTIRRSVDDFKALFTAKNSREMANAILQGFDWMSTPHAKNAKTQRYWSEKYDDLYHRGMSIKLVITEEDMNFFRAVAKIKGIEV